MKAHWERIERGWWCCRRLDVAVVFEHDAKWHSYATDKDTYETTPAFRRLEDAKGDAERRSVARANTRRIR